MKAITLNGVEEEFLLGRPICGQGFHSITFDYKDARQAALLTDEQVANWFLHVIRVRMEQTKAKDILDATN